MLNAMLVENPHQFPIMLSDDSNIDPIAIEVEKSLFEFVQEGYNERLMSAIDIFAFARAIVDNFPEFVEFVKWYKSQPFRDGGGENMNTYQVVIEFYTHCTGYMDLEFIRDTLTDEFNQPTYTMIVYQSMAYRFGHFSEQYADDAIAIFCKEKKDA